MAAMQGRGESGRKRALRALSPAQTKWTTSPPWLASAVLACGERKTDARVIRGM